MPRLNQKRQDRLEPRRIRECKQKLEDLGFECLADDKSIKFQYNGSQVTLWPYSGWHSGKTIKDGRGFKKLLKQIT